MVDARLFRPVPRGAVLLWVAGGIAAVLALGLVASPSAAQQPAAKASYDKLCAACHGPMGHGDGLAAAALTPRPTNFADSSVVKRTDAELARLIGDGKPPMPAFSKQLSASQIMVLVAYVRELGKKPK